MAQDIAVVVVHGMGAQKKGYSRPMRDEINGHLSQNKASRIKWGEIYWADVLEPRQKAYLHKADARHDLDFIGLRRFMISAFGDASAYRKTRDQRNTTYNDIHQRVATAIAELEQGLSPATPLVILAHSLGGHIMSNYIWDMQKAGNSTTANLSDFQQMKTLAGFVTFGCNIPFFTFAYSKDDIIPIRFPGSSLPPALKEKARWLNFYDPDDVLGYPLKAINRAYRDVVSRDIGINVGGLFSSWNPVSHTKYWLDNDFTKPVARFIGRLL